MGRLNEAKRMPEPGDVNLSENPIRDGARAKALNL